MSNIAGPQTFELWMDYISGFFEAFLVSCKTTWSIMGNFGVTFKKRILCIKFARQWVENAC